MVKTKTTKKKKSIKKNKDPSILSQLWYSITRKTELQMKYKKHSEYKKNWQLKDMVGNTPAGPSIYGNMERGKAIREEYVFHTWFKYKIIVPCFLLLKRFFRKYIQVPVSKTSLHDRNFVIFDETTEQAIKQWTEEYQAFQNGKMEKYDKKELKRRLNSNCQDFLRVVKELVIWVSYKDTVYREFLNIWMHCLAQRMLKEYGGKQVKHWFYSTSSVYNPMYFHLWGKYQSEQEFVNLPIDEQERQLIQQIENTHNQLKEQEFSLLQIRNKRQYNLDNDEFKLSEALSNVRMKKKLNTELLTGEYKNRIIEESIKELQRYKEVRLNEQETNKEIGSVRTETGPTPENTTGTPNTTVDNKPVGRETPTPETVKDNIPEKNKTGDFIKDNGIKDRKRTKTIKRKSGRHGRVQ